MKFIKFNIFLAICLSVFIVMLPFYPLLKILPWQTRRILNQLTRFYLKLFSFVFGIKVIEDKDLNHQVARGALLVANHLSYIDILAIASRIPTCFVTSVEMKNTPFLGQLAQLAGCVFVERRSKSNLSNEIKEVEQALKNGLNVVVFPEAKSTNGEQVILFRRALFQAAINSNRSVYPFCLNYLKLDNEKINLKNRDHVFWYGDMNFFSHLWHLLSFSKVELSLKYLAPISDTRNLNSTDLANLAHQQVSLHYRGINS